MKRLVLAAVAFSMLAAPAMQAGAAPLNAPGASQSTYTHVDWRKPSHRDVKKRVIVKKKRVIARKKVVARNHWRHGQRYSGWRQHRPVHDWQRRHLRRPGRGQEWIRVGDDYLLVGIASGIIGAMIAAH